MWIDYEQNLIRNVAPNQDRVVEKFVFCGLPHGAEVTMDRKEAEALWERLGDRLGKGPRVICEISLSEEVGKKLVEMMDKQALGSVSIFSE